MTEKDDRNLQQAVPFFGVIDLEASLAFYQKAGFRMTLDWFDEGRRRWCWIEREGVAFMLQEFREDLRPEGKMGLGTSVCVMCRDALALHREFRANGLEPRRPFVGNRLWVVELTDPDGYLIYFESPTDLPEDTEYDESVHG